MPPEIIRRAQLENYATLTAIVVVVLGLYAMGAGGWCSLGFILLLNMNIFKKHEAN